METNRPPHQPVLYHEIIGFLRPKSPGRYVDATLGAGGHAWGILDECGPDGYLLGLDLDPQALEIANQRLIIYGKRFISVHASYITLLEQVQRLGWDGVDGILLDLGVSSMQIDTPERGFSFQGDGPLDMRFDPSKSVTAADLVNTLEEEQLADILWRYGEERYSRRIARSIVTNRPIYTTQHLAKVIRNAFPHEHSRIDPATRSFQALRIAVNDELESVKNVLPQAIEALRPGGRLAIIAFHSLEDRLVKQFFHRESRDCICPPEQPVCTCGHKATIEIITRHPVMALEEEINQNPRARSARLRIAEKR